MEFKGTTKRIGVLAGNTVRETLVKSNGLTLNTLEFIIKPELSVGQAPFSVGIEIRSNYPLPFSDIDFHKPLKIIIENVE